MAVGPIPGAEVFLIVLTLLDPFWGAKGGGAVASSRNAAFSSWMVTGRSGIRTSPIRLWLPFVNRLNHMELVGDIDMVAPMPSSVMNDTPTPPGTVWKKLDTHDRIFYTVSYCTVLALILGSSDASACSFFATCIPTSSCKGNGPHTGYRRSLSTCFCGAQVPICSDGRSLH